MLRRSRQPSLESLERREVFHFEGWTDGIIWQFDSAPEAGPAAGEVFSSAPVGRPVSVAVGDVNNDGRLDLVASGLFGDFDGDGDVDGADFLRSPGGQLSRLDMIVDYIDPDSYRAAVDDLIRFNSLLPYLEQDNIYKSALPFSNTLLDDQAFVSPVHLDLLGIVEKEGAHDALFAELGASEFDRGTNEGNQIIAILIGLVASTKNQDIEVENDETHWVGHGQRRAAVTDLIIDPFNSSSLLNSTEYRTSLLASAEYYQVSGASGGVWKSTN